VTGWRAALRFARRSVRRDLARSILVIALIAVPVAGVTVADGLIRTITDRDVDVDRAMGTADIRVDVSERKAFDVERRLPDGARAVPIGARYIDGSLRLVTGDRVVRTKLDVVALGDPLTRHLARLSSGRLPDGPGEVAVTRPLAERLGLLDGEHLRSGARITTFDGVSVAVTGLVDNPYYLRREAVVARPGTPLVDMMLDGSPHPVGYLVDLPDGVDAEAFARAWWTDGTGITFDECVARKVETTIPPKSCMDMTDEATVTTRASFVDQTPVGGYLADAAGGPMMLFAGLGLLGIVLTASAAFAVGARRQVRELGLVAANGGTAKHIRRIVLAQGLVLGVLGAASGLVLGAAATVLGTPLWQRLTEQLVEDLRFGWVELAIAAGMGVLASVVAALVPAVGVARMRPVDALAGRFRVATTRARLPLLGVLMVLVGVAVVVAAGLLGRRRVFDHQELLTQNLSAPPLDQTWPIGGILLGTVLAVTGIVVVIPALMAGVARLGGRLPLSGRLAVRDAVRHRGRTVAAVAAVMVTVAGSVATAFVFTARANNTPRTLPENVVIAELDWLSRRAEVGGEQQLEQAAANMRAAVPGAVAHDVTFVGSPGGKFASILLTRRSAPNCGSNQSQQLGIGEPDLIELSTGRQPDARVLSALAEGRIVVFDDCLISSAGTVRLQLTVPRMVIYMDDGQVEYVMPEPIEMPAYRAERVPGIERSDRLPVAFLSVEAAAGRGWTPYTVSTAVTYPDSADVAVLRAAAEDAGVGSYVEESVSDQVETLYLILAGVAALVALLSAGVTVALSAADGRTDLATLAALGAQPRRRRTLAGARALVISGLGTVAGLMLGVLVGVAAIPATGMLSLTVPWQHLGLTAVCVSFLAAATAMIATPSRLPMITRRQS
jgi:putative ABC transport system permease protein